VEWAEVAGNLYGTPTLEVPPGRDLLLEIDVQGARQILDQHPEAVVILVVPPSRDIQRRRLEARGDSPEVIARRLAMSEKEEADGRLLAGHLVVNDDLHRAVDEVAGILQRHRRTHDDPRDDRSPEGA